MVPLVSVAWADGNIDDKEREAIVKAAEGSGIAAGTASHSLINSWLSEKPNAELFDSWKSYVGGLKESMPPEAFGQLKNSVITRAKEVAAAAGGFLGVGKVSEQENKVIAELESAFE